jgi:hypothetical protein
MLEAILIGGGWSVLCYWLGRWGGRASTLVANRNVINAADVAGYRRALADAHREAVAVQEKVSTRSLCGRAIVARLRQLADDAGGGECASS